ncbi:VOC family protein [Vibrio sp. WJH972]
MSVANKIDHIVVGAESLEQGIDFLRKNLGVTLPKASKHEAMSTHNCVAPTGNDSFLEILSIDPDAPNPGRARWFAMDEEDVKTKLQQSAYAHHWVVGTDDLDALIESSPVPLGEIVTFTRGERSWRLNIPSDGSMLEEGVIPTFIEWSPGAHPSSAMTDLGLTLKSIEITHPEPEWLTGILTKLGVGDLASVSAGIDKAISFKIVRSDGEIVTVS